MKNRPFTSRTRKVLARAREHAIRLRHTYVGTEHIVLGLADEGGAAGAVLERLGIPAEAVGERVREAVREGTEEAPPGELPYTSLARKALEYSMAEARRLAHGHVGTAHLLLGLIRQERGIAARVLGELGADLGDARRAAADVLRGQGSDAADEGAHRPFRVRIDDESGSSIYEQIVARIREGVATGALRPGERLQPVRRLADELDIAPGTVARAYRELERLGVVETDGARGTRVADPRRDRPPAGDRHETLVGLLRPVAVAAFHMGASAGELRSALEPAMEGILGEGGPDEDAGGHPA